MIAGSTSMYHNPNLRLQVLLSILLSRSRLEYAEYEYECASFLGAELVV